MTVKDSNIILFLKEKIKYIESLILKRIDGNRRTIAFVSYNQSYRNQVGNLHRKFKEAGFNVINIVGFAINDRFEKEADTFVIPKLVCYKNKNYILDIDFDFIDIIFSPDKEFITEGAFNKDFLSKRAKKIYLPHDAIGGYPHDFFDYCVMPSQESINRYKSNKFRKGFCLIPAGYPKLDYSLEKYNKFKNKHNIDEDSIIYAPTKRAIVEIFKPLNAICAVGFDSSIIECLLKEFNEKIIFRPHPHNLVYSNITQSHYSSLLIQDKFKDNKRVILNYSQDYLKYYAMSKFMVTDTSDTAYNYAFTTIKPAIFFDPFHSIPHANNIGERVHSLSELIKKSNNILKNIDYYKNKILNFRNLMIENIEKSAEYLIQNIDYIISDKKNPDWFYYD